MSKKPLHLKSNQVVVYCFAKETPGTYRFDADVPDGTRLPVGSNSVYLDKAKFAKCPERVTATYAVE